MISIECLETKLLNNNNWYGRFQLAPFRKGEGLTVANALRRTLLAEKSNFYISWVDFYNASIPYSVLTGMRESIFDILLNLKQVIFTSNIIMPSKKKEKQHSTKTHSFTERNHHKDSFKHKNPKVARGDEWYKAMGSIKDLEATKYDSLRLQQLFTPYNLFPNSTNENLFQTSTLPSFIKNSDYYQIDNSIDSKPNRLLPFIAYICVKGPAIVYAKHIKLPFGIKCVDPDKYIVTLADDGLFYLRFAVIVKINDGSSLLTDVSRNNDFTNLFQINASAPRLNEVPPFLPKSTYNLSCSSIKKYNNHQSNISKQKLQYGKTGNVRKGNSAADVFMALPNQIDNLNKNNNTITTQLKLPIHNINYMKKKQNTYDSSNLTLSNDSLKSTHENNISILANLKKTCLLNIQIKHYYIKSGRFDRFLFDFLKPLKPSLKLKKYPPINASAGNLLKAYDLQKPYNYCFNYSKKQRMLKSSLNFNNYLLESDYGYQINPATVQPSNTIDTTVFSPMHKKIFQAAATGTLYEKSFTFNRTQNESLKLENNKIWSFFYPKLKYQSIILHDRFLQTIAALFPFQEISGKVAFCKNFLSPGNFSGQIPFRGDLGHRLENISNLKSFDTFNEKQYYRSYLSWFAKTNQTEAYELLAIYRQQLFQPSKIQPIPSNNVVLKSIYLNVEYLLYILKQSTIYCKNQRLNESFFDLTDNFKWSNICNTYLRRSPRYQNFPHSFRGIWATALLFNISKTKFSIKSFLKKMQKKIKNDQILSQKFNFIINKNNILKSLLINQENLGSARRKINISNNYNRFYYGQKYSSKYSLMDGFLILGGNDCKITPSTNKPRQFIFHTQNKLPNIPLMPAFTLDFGGCNSRSSKGCKSPKVTPKSSFEESFSITKPISMFAFYKKNIKKAPFQRDFTKVAWGLSKNKKSRDLATTCSMMGGYNRSLVLANNNSLKSLSSNLGLNFKINHNRMQVEPFNINIYNSKIGYTLRYTYPFKYTIFETFLQFIFKPMVPSLASKINVFFHQNKYGNESQIHNNNIRLPSRILNVKKPPTLKCDHLKYNESFKIYTNLSSVRNLLSSNAKKSSTLFLDSGDQKQLANNTTINTNSLEESFMDRQYLQSKGAYPAFMTKSNLKLASIKFDRKVKSNLTTYSIKTFEDYMQLSKESLDNDKRLVKYGFPRNFTDKSNIPSCFTEERYNYFTSPKSYFVHNIVPSKLKVISIQIKNSAKIFVNEKPKLLFLRLLPFTWSVWNLVSVSLRLSQNSTLSNASDGFFKVDPLKRTLDHNFNLYDSSVIDSFKIDQSQFAQLKSLPAKFAGLISNTNPVCSLLVNATNHNTQLYKISPNLDLVGNYWKSKTKKSLYTSKLGKNSHTEILTLKESYKWRITNIVNLNDAWITIPFKESFDYPNVSINNKIHNKNIPFKIKSIKQSSHNYPQIPPKSVDYTFLRKPCMLNFSFSRRFVGWYFGNELQSNFSKLATSVRLSLPKGKHNAATLHSEKVWTLPYIYKDSNRAAANHLNIYVTMISCLNKEYSENLNNQVDDHYYLFSKNNLVSKINTVAYFKKSWSLNKTGKKIISKSLPINFENIYYKNVLYKTSKITSRLLTNEIFPLVVNRKFSNSTFIPITNHQFNRFIFLKKNLKHFSHYIASFNNFNLDSTSYQNQIINSLLNQNSFKMNSLKPKDFSILPEHYTNNQLFASTFLRDKTMISNWSSFINKSPNLNHDKSLTKTKNEKVLDNTKIKHGAVAGAKINSSLKALPLTTTNNVVFFYFFNRQNEIAERNIKSFQATKPLIFLKDNNTATWQKKPKREIKRNVFYNSPVIENFTSNANLQQKDFNASPGYYLTKNSNLDALVANQNIEYGNTIDPIKSRLWLSSFFNSNESYAISMKSDLFLQHLLNLDLEKREYFINSSSNKVNPINSNNSYTAATPEIPNNHSVANFLQDKLRGNSMTNIGKNNHLKSTSPEFTSGGVLQNFENVVSNNRQYKTEKLPYKKTGEKYTTHNISYIWRKTAHLAFLRICTWKDFNIKINSVIERRQNWYNLHIARLGPYNYKNSETFYKLPISLVESLKSAAPKIRSSLTENSIYLVKVKKPPRLKIGLSALTFSISFIEIYPIFLQNGDSPFRKSSNHCKDSILEKQFPFRESLLKKSNFLGFFRHEQYSTNPVFSFGGKKCWQHSIININQMQMQIQDLNYDSMTYFIWLIFNAYIEKRMSRFSFPGKPSPKSKLWFPTLAYTLLSTNQDKIYKDLLNIIDKELYQKICKIMEISNHSNQSEALKFKESRMVSYFSIKENTLPGHYIHKVNYIVESNFLEYASDPRELIDFQQIESKLKNSQDNEYIQIDIWTNGEFSPRKALLNAFLKLFELFYNLSKYNFLKPIEI